MRITQKQINAVLTLAYPAGKKGHCPCRGAGRAMGVCFIHVVVGQGKLWGVGGAGVDINTLSPCWWRGNAVKLDFIWNLNSCCIACIHSIIRQYKISI